MDQINLRRSKTYVQLYYVNPYDQITYTVFWEFVCFYSFLPVLSSDQEGQILVIHAFASVFKRPI